MKMIKQPNYGDRNEAAELSVALSTHLSLLIITVSSTLSSIVADFFLQIPETGGRDFTPL
jgi:hypothetical protein